MPVRLTAIAHLATELANVTASIPDLLISTLRERAAHFEDHFFEDHF